MSPPVNDFRWTSTKTISRSVQVNCLYTSNLLFRLPASSMLRSLSFFATPCSLLPRNKYAFLSCDIPMFLSDCCKPVYTNWLLEESFTSAECLLFINIIQSLICDIRISPIENVFAFSAQLFIFTYTEPRAYTHAHTHINACIIIRYSPSLSTSLLCWCQLPGLGLVVWLFRIWKRIDKFVYLYNTDLCCKNVILNY